MSFYTREEIPSGTLFSITKSNPLNVMESANGGKILFTMNDGDFGTMLDDKIVYAQILAKNSIGYICAEEDILTLTLHHGNFESRAWRGVETQNKWRFLIENVREVLGFKKK